jgi:cytidylate kinase
VQRLALIEKIRRGTGAVLGDPVTALEEHVQRGYVEVARAINGLQDLAGRSRPVRVQDVVAMGRLVAYEEMILAGSAFRIAITGQPYSGKTEVGALLARRLRHSYISTGALGRALALVEQTGREQGNADIETPRGLVKALFDAGFAMTSSHDAPYYRVELAGADVTAVLGDTAQLQVRGAQLLDDDAVRDAVRDALAARTGAGLVVEGAYAATLLSGAAWHFHLTGDAGVRRARLMSHRPDVESEADAEKLLRRLDEGQKSDGVDPTVVDVGSRPAAAAALEVLWHLLPQERRPGAVAAAGPP